MFLCSTSSTLIRRLSLASLSVTLLGAISFLPQQLPAQTSDQGGAETDRFVNDLLKKMTLEEKIGQMSQLARNRPESISWDERILKGQAGSFLFFTDAKEINRLQHLAVEKGRLHIPLIFGYDVVHGFRTIYPVPLALAASWDPAQVEEAQRMAAKEASSVGINWTFGPMVDIARDARWGRMMEGAGEDPYLGARMAEAQVRGFQGETIGSPEHILTSVKHFAGYGAAEGGRDYDASNISDEQLWNVYLPPFEAAVRAGSGSLMTAYMDLNGVPPTGNNFLLHDVLRDKWEFKGFVVSDWETIPALTVHGFAADRSDAAVRAVNAGVDMEMTSHVYREELAAAVKQGLVQEATIDEAVRRILTVKYQLGLFTHPYVLPSRAETELLTSEQRQAARKAAERSAVLLRNEGDLLPLKSSLISLAIIGPLADSKTDIMGSWSLAGHPADSVTVLEGIRKRFPSGVKILSTKGVEIERGQPSIFDDQFPNPAPTLKTDAERDAEFAHAIALIKQAQVAVLVLGEAQTMSGERASRSTFTLPGKQQQLLEAAVATGKPIVLVLLNGRPLDINWASQHVPAILDAWYPGTEGGNAVADLLFGDANPGGKLPVTWPRSAGQEPLYYAHNLTQIPDDSDALYWDGSSAPLYPFGYGLSYAKFKLDSLNASATSVKSGASLNVSINVQNTSNVAGDQVVQLYTHQRSASASRPVRELKVFRRVTVKPGEKQTITFTLDTHELGFWSPQTHQWSIEPGVFDLWVGADSNATEHTTFTVMP